MKKGYLIAFTGIDGSGKTTQAKLLVESLKLDGKDVSYIRSKWEPFFLRPLIKRWKSGIEGEAIKLNHNEGMTMNKKRELLSNPIFRWLWLGAFFVDYGLQLFIKIRFGLLKKQLIISDRIFYDSIIDQAVNLGDKKGWLLDSLDSFWMKILFPNPDIVIYVDCPEDVAFSRKNDDYTPDIEYLTERRKLYLDLAGMYRWVKVEGTLPVKEIAAKIKGEVYKTLKNL